MAKNAHYAIMMDVQNGMGSDVRVEHEILESTGLGSAVPAGYYKTFWVKAGSEAEAISLAEDKTRKDAAELPFIDDEVLCVESVSPCSWWRYFRNKKHAGRTFYGFDSE